MKIAVLKERRRHERRIAATPDAVKRYIALGAEIAVETGAGAAASFDDDSFQLTGAAIAADAASAMNGADVVLKVQRPMLAGEGEVDELALFADGQALVAMLNPLIERDAVAAYAQAGVTAFAMELMPRITRAQSMDVLSSQANLAGYKSVLDACEVFDRAMPMMMTAAGTVAPARVLVMGAGVAGLQAIATARRLGAIVSATDVRPAAKEQVESLGANFVMVEDEESKQAETAGGYAREMSDAYKAKQAALIAETIKKQDIVICTALIPGRQAPTLITGDMVASMKPGSVIVDLAIDNGGNCTASVGGEIAHVEGVRVVAHYNVPSRLAIDASSLYARNLVNFLTPCFDKDSGGFAFNWSDELINGTCVARGGKVVHPMLTGEAEGD
ncbi:MAG: Re/Si-specific NAD(P)(+) transhydrogenase subunit alpha [Alphaproteobacteria bacterium]